MFQIGNRFGAKKPNPVIPASPLASSAGTQETLTRASNAYDKKLAELAETRSRPTEIEQRLGEHSADTASRRAMTFTRWRPLNQR